MQNSAEKRMNWKTALLLLCLVWPPDPSIAAANQIQQGRNLAQESDKSNPPETSPSPSPDQAAAKPQSGNDRVDANPPKTPVVPKETCDPNFNQCHDDVQTITACLLANAGDVSQGLFLLVRNDGENSLKLNVRVLPEDSTSDVGDIPGHQSKKIIVSSNASRSSAFVLNAAHWTCKIERRVRGPPSFPSYIASIKPINGVYLLFGTALLIGILWACFKLGKDVRHLNGVPYQELEMEQQESGAGASLNALTADSWDQSWDDDDDGWDLEMAAKSAGGSHVGNGEANGISSKSADGNGNGNGWGSDWND